MNEEDRKMLGVAIWLLFLIGAFLLILTIFFVMFYLEMTTDMSHLKKYIGL